MELFRKEVVEARRRKLLGDVVIVQPIKFSMMTVTFAVCILITFVFLYWSSYAQKVTVRGSLVPSGGLIEVRTDWRGMVSKLHVEQGTHVKTGQKLLTLHNSAPNSTGSSTIEALTTELSEQYKALLEGITTVKQQGAATEDAIRLQIANSNEELAVLESELEIRRKILSIAQLQHDNALKVVERGIISRVELQRRHTTWLTSQADVKNIEIRLLTLKGTLATKRQELADNPKKVSTEVARLKRELSELRVRQGELEEKNTYVVTSGMDGIVTDIQVQLGEMNDGTDPLMTIRGLDDPLIAELAIPTNVAGSVERGQRVFMRYSAYPYQQYGIYEGEISQISQSVYLQGQNLANEPLEKAAYRAIVTLDKQEAERNGKTSMLQPGIDLQADIQLEKRRIIQLLLGELNNFFSN